MSRVGAIQVWLLAGVLVLTGCSDGKDFTPPLSFPDLPRAPAQESFGDGTVCRYTYEQDQLHDRSCVTPFSSSATRYVYDGRGLLVEDVSVDHGVEVKRRHYH